MVDKSSGFFAAFHGTLKMSVELRYLFKNTKKMRKKKELLINTFNYSRLFKQKNLWK